MRARAIDRLAMAGLVLAVAVMNLPLLLRPFHTAPIKVWDFGPTRPPPPWRQEFYFLAALDRVSVVRHGQFPLWTPYMGGGYPLMGFPESAGLTARLPVLLLFGVVPSFKVEFLLTQAAAAVGLYLLLRRVSGMGVTGGLVAASCFAFSAVTTTWVHHLVYVTRSAWVPLILYLLYTARGRPWRLLWAALVVGLVMAPQVRILLAALSFMMLVGVTRAFESDAGRRGPNWRLLGLMAAAVGWSALIWMGKWVGLAHVLSLSGRRVFVAEGEEALDPARAAAVWIAVLAAMAVLPRLRRWRSVSARARRRDVTARLAVFALVCTALLLAPPGWPEEAAWYQQQDRLAANLDGLVTYGTLLSPTAGMFTWEKPARYGFPVGYMGIGLAAFALIAAPRRLWRWIVVIFFFALLTVAPILPFDLLRVVEDLPIPAVNREGPWQPFFYRALCLSVLAGWGSHLLVARVGAVRRRWVGAGLVALNLALLAWMMVPRLCYTVSAAPPPPPARGPFHNVPYGYVVEGMHYQWVQANRAFCTFDSYLPNPDAAAVQPAYRFDEATRRRRPNPDYQNEVYFQWHPENRVKWTDFSPNRWTFAVNVSRTDLLVVNQVYDRFWRCDAGPVVSNRGLIAVRLTRPGQYDVRMRYVPTPYYIGVGVGGLALIAGVVLIVRSSRRIKRRATC